MSDARNAWLRNAWLGVHFVWRHDRYAHEILARHEGDWIPILTSFEGTADDAWPASPALQSLHLESRGGATQVALLVGMAGRSHWSASVELDGKRLRFDVACRMRAARAPWLGSRYRAHATHHDQHDRHGSLAANQGLRFEVVAAADSRLAIDSEVVSVAAATIADEQPRTVRWCYDVRLQQHGDAGAAS